MKSSSLLVLALALSVPLLFAEEYSDNPSSMNIITAIPDHSSYEYDEVSLPLETHPKCGVGTIFEPETYSCILKDVINPEEWCGTGTYYNATENSCLLKKTLHPSFNEHKV